MSEIVLGILPPQAIEVEQIVLGSFMLESDCFSLAPIKQEWFYSDKHQTICKAILELQENNDSVDIITVTNRLREQGKLESIGGAYYITMLTSRIASAANIASHVEIVRKKYKRRELIRLVTDVKDKAYNETISIEEITSIMQDGLLSTLDHDVHRVLTLYDGCTEILNRIRQNLKGKSLSGIDTGFQRLNTFTGGWQKTDLVIIAGETGNGKTSLALNHVSTAIKRGVPIAIYSLEMPVVQLVARLISIETDVRSKAILYEKINDNSILNLVDTGINKLKDLPLFFDEKSNNSLEAILNSIRRLYLKYQIELVVVDYIQLVSCGKNDEAGIAEIARKLKNIAKELNITVIALSQLSRDRSDPTPTISRLRGSGQLEEAADIILMPFNAGAYGRSFSEPFENESTEGKIQIIVGKGRNIGTGTFILNFQSDSTKFSDV
jgi:replicative DNA helicase